MHLDRFGFATLAAMLASAGSAAFADAPVPAAEEAVRKSAAAYVEA